MYIYYMIKYMYIYMSMHTCILVIILICVYEMCALEKKLKK